MNPLNVPKARQIEDFWEFISQIVYEGGREANTEQQLIRRIQAFLRKIDVSFLQSLMKGIKTKLKSIRHLTFFFKNFFFN